MNSVLAKGNVLVDIDQSFNMNLKTDFLMDFTVQRLQQPQASVPAYEFARFYSIATNATVARALGLTLPAEPELRARLQSIAP